MLNILNPKKSPPLEQALEKVVDQLVQLKDVLIDSRVYACHKDKYLFDKEAFGLYERGSLSEENQAIIDPIIDAVFEAGIAQIKPDERYSIEHEGVDYILSADERHLYENTGTNSEPIYFRIRVIEYDWFRDYYITIPKVKK